MYRIDWKRWWAAVQAVEVAKKEAKPAWVKLEHAKELTVLYSVRAHGRGRIHRRQAGLTDYDARKLLGDKKSRPCEDFTAAGGKLTLDLDLDDQAKFIGDRWKEFVRVEEAAA